MSHSAFDGSALEREAIRLCQRYIDEVVLPFDLCPWAAPALRQQRVKIVVLSDLVDAPEQALERAAERGAALLAECAREPRFELVLLLYPRFELGRNDFDHLLRNLRAHHASAPERFVMAAFHPVADLDTTTAERLVPFLRRSPDPMVQALRQDVWERIDPGRGTGTAFVSLDRFLSGQLDAPADCSPRERVAQTNLETVLSPRGRELMRAIDAIQEDRQRTYATLRQAAGR